MNTHVKYSGKVRIRTIVVIVLLLATIAIPLHRITGPIQDLSGRWTGDRLFYSVADEPNSVVAMETLDDLTDFIGGTANQITVTDDGDGTVTLAGPQDLATTSSPTFVDLTLSSPSSIYSLDHDSFAGFVADEHIAHSGVTLTAGTGLTGGGTIAANRTFNVDVGIGDDKIVQMDDLDAAASDYAKFTAAGLEGRSYTEVKQDLDLEIGTDVLAQQTIGVANDNLVEMDDADAAVSDYAKFTANGLEGRSYTEVKQDLDLEIGTDVAAQTHASQHAVGGADTVFPADPDADRYLMWDDVPGVLVWGSPAGAGDFLADGTVPMTAPIKLTEVAAAGADAAGIGQLWVKNEAPNELWFTDDAGTDVQLGVAGGGGATPALDNLAAVAINTSLISDTAATDDLGTEALYWRKLYVGADISFEGATDNDFQTTLSVTDPTADRAITLPDAAGTILLSGHTFTGDVTATLDTDGSTALAIADSVNVSSWNLTTSTATDSFLLYDDSDTAATAPILGLRKARDGDPTDDLSSGDYLGHLRYEGYHTAGYHEGATIRAIVDAAPGNNDMPTRLEFLTAADGSATPTLRGAVDSAGAWKFGDGVWTNYAQISATGAITFAGTGTITLPANAVDSDNYADGSIDHEHLAADAISGLAEVTSADNDYMMVWDATDSALKKVDLGEVRGGGSATAWDDIGDPDGNGIIDFGVHTASLDVNDLRIGDVDGGNYFKIDGGALSVVGVTTAALGTITSAGTAVVLAGGANHDGFSDFVADEHIAHSTVTMTAGEGITGGGTIASTRTFDLDFTGLAGDTIGEYDELAFHDVGDTTHKKITFANFEGTLSHDGLADFVANEHIDWTADQGATNIHAGNYVESDPSALLTAGTDNVKDTHIDWGSGAGQVDLADVPGGTAGANTFNLSAATVVLPARTAGHSNHFRFNIFNPNAAYDVDTQICIVPKLAAAITITNIEVTCDAAANEIDMDLKWADAFIGLANAAVIDVIDTTSGVTSISAGFDDATVAAGKCIYVEFGADPHADIKQICIDISWDYD